MIPHLKAKVANFTLRILKWRLTSFTHAQKISTHFNYYVVTICGVVLVACLYIPIAQYAITKFKNIDTIFIAIGGMIGTMLALVFSLSIIPIQRAVETFSPSISWLYRNDRITQCIYIILAIFCLLSFAMSIDGVAGLQISKLLPVEIIMVAITLDLLRWHYRRISRMLEPGNAINQLSLRIMKYIDKTQQRISRLAQIQWWALPADQKKDRQKEQLESALYLAFRNHHLPINKWSSELAEISYKATARNEIHTSKLAIDALKEVACYYLNCRKDNLILYPAINALFLVHEADVSNILTPVYEHFLNINRNAIMNKNVTTCIYLIKAFGAIANHTVILKSNAFRDNIAPLTYSPMYYLNECVNTAQSSGLDDVALQGSRELLNVAKNASDNVQITDVHLPAIEGCYKIATTFLITGKGILSNGVLEHLMIVAHHLLERRHFEFVIILQNILEKIEALVPLAIAHEKTFGSPVIGLPLSLPYDLTNKMSIAYLVARGKVLIEPKKDKEWINPYRDFIEMNEEIYRHFRNLAEKVDFGTSFLLLYITRTIKRIAGVYLEFLKNPETDNIRHKEELVKQIPWYTAFFWVTFSKATTFNYQQAENACDTLAWIGMSFHNAKFYDVVESSVSNISSIIGSFCKITKNADPYQVADLLIFIWHIQLLAEAKNDKDLLTKIEKKMAKPKTVTDEEWIEVLDALEIRKEQLNEELSKDEKYRLTDNATGLLRHLLGRNENN